MVSELHQFTCGDTKIFGYSLHMMNLANSNAAFLHENGWECWFLGECWRGFEAHWKLLRRFNEKVRLGMCLAFQGLLRCEDLIDYK